MKLEQLLITLPSATVSGPIDLEIQDIAYDSRRVESGFLFVAVPTVGGDAHSGGYSHIPQAITQGAVAVVAERHFDIPDHIPLIVIPNAREALADIAAEFFGNPSRQIHVYAVTGTDGKTTTTYLLDGIFSAAGFQTGLIGTVETKIGTQRQFNADRMTTPESLDLQRLLRTMLKAGVTHVSLEASSHALALHRLRATHFAACAVTNITGDHVEFHGSFDAYFNAKASLFTALASDRPAVLNRDDALYARLRSRVTNSVVTYGDSDAADLHFSMSRAYRDSTTCLLHSHGTTAQTRVPLPGQFNLYNALAATALALLEGLSLQDVAKTLPNISPPPGRMQHVDAGQDFDVVIDYAHTPNAFLTTLSSLQSMTRPGRLFAVFGAAGNRDHSKRPMFARIARDHADYFFITNEDPFDEQADAIMDEVASGIDPGLEGKQYEREPDRTTAIQRAISMARPGDTVVILGKGHEQSIVVNGAREPWSDSQVARRVLETMR